MRRQLLCLSFLAMLGGCHKQPQMSGSVEGPGGFPVVTAQEYTFLQDDGGAPIWDSVVVNLTDTKIDPMCTANVGTFSRVFHDVQLSVVNLGQGALRPGTYAIQERPDGGTAFSQVVAGISSSPIPELVAVDGGVTLTRLGPQGAEGSFSVWMRNSQDGGLQPLSGRFQAPFCRPLSD